MKKEIKFLKNIWKAKSILKSCRKLCWSISHTKQIMKMWKLCWSL